MLKCSRCRNAVDPEKSTICVLLTRYFSSVSADIAYTSKVESGSVVMHSNGDRECGKQVVGYRKMLLQDLELEADFDISFLDLI